MLMHPDLMLNLVNDRHRELVAESDRRSVLTIARATRRAGRARAARSRAAGTLAPCERSAAVPAR
ncbi:hypothetical protein [Jidongwangia harbinensis]|uniref:hypothetical protein n=1 Tax=Jidongwangia harbinensis TaxID=2878561 RepID=UPI001CD91E0B|nr:hypothetical protein [Jidongwangia harbinensis]MCA2212049.1 hypothetical protein [Jidongwangia harbinensis]